MTAGHAPAGLRGLYAVADTATLAGTGVEAPVAAALRGGARVVQYRDKSADHERRHAEAACILRLCRAFGAWCIVNDDVALAREIGADGVHVGGDDAAPAAARATLGPSALVGVSCYDDLARAHAAAAAGASYVAFGRVYPSTTKPSDIRAPLGLLGQARAQTGLPVCAIGGITAERAPEVIAAGADLLAVIGDLFTATDVEARARAYAEAFART